MADRKKNDEIKFYVLIIGNKILEQNQIQSYKIIIKLHVFLNEYANFIFWLEIYQNIYFTPSLCRNFVIIGS